MTFLPAVIKRVGIRTGSLSAVLLLTVVVVLASSCGRSERAKDRIGVAVSILPLAEFVEQVGKERVEATVMVPPGAAPHTYEPKPSQLKAVSEAEMFVKVGSGLEFELVWMDKLVEINTDMMVLNSSEGVELTGTDPHVWLSPLNAKKMVRNICSGLMRLDPDNGQYYTENRNEYLERLDELDAYVKETLTGVEKRKFIVYHPAWGFFARDYGLEEIPVEKAGKEPTAGEIKDVLEQAAELHNKVVFVSPQFATKGAETVAREMGGSVMHLDPLPRSYMASIRITAERLAQAMR